MKKDTSILLSRIVLFSFFVLLIFVDVVGLPVLFWFFASNKSAVLASGHPGYYIYILGGAFYLLSVPAYIAMYWMNRLLKNLSTGETFTRENTKCLRYTCWCLTAAFVILVPCGVFYVSLLVVALAFAFMALIVHIVKNVFEKAVSMKDELDLTV